MNQETLNDLRAHLNAMHNEAMGISMLEELVLDEKQVRLKAAIDLIYAGLDALEGVLEEQVVNPPVPNV